MIDHGLNDYEIARKTGVSRSAVQRWRTHGLPREEPKQSASWHPRDRVAYAYLLGIYLGDGYVSKAATSPVLEIALDRRYPNIAAECVDAIWGAAHLRAQTRLRRSDSGTSLRVTAGGRIWPLAFPQHGRGKKHHRAIELEDWQQSIVGALPRPFLRGPQEHLGRRSAQRRNTRFVRRAKVVRFMRAEGLEPPSSFEHRHLKPACFSSFTTPARTAIVEARGVAHRP